MYTKIIAILATLSLLTACSSTPEVQSGKDAEVIGDKLHRIENSRAKMAYIDPDVDFSKYKRILVRPLGVDNVEIVQPNTSSSVYRNSNWELTDKDKVALQQAFADAMKKQLEERGDFPIVEERGDDVLEIAAMITDLAPSAPKDDNSSRAAGRSRVYTDGAGSIAVAVVFGDSETGEVLALVKDSRSSNSHWGANNSVSNMATVRQVFNSWAMQINNGLNTVTGSN